MKKIILSLFGWAQTKTGENIIARQPEFKTTMPTDKLTFRQWCDTHNPMKQICPDYTQWAKEFKVSNTYTYHLNMPHTDIITA